MHAKEEFARQFDRELASKSFQQFQFNPHNLYGDGVKYIETVPTRNQPLSIGNTPKRFNEESILRIAAIKGISFQMNVYGGTCVTKTAN